MKSRVPKNSLAQFTENLQAQGRYTFTQAEVIKQLKISPNAFRKAAMILKKKKRLLRLANTFYVIIPFEYKLSQGLPPTAFIDDFMKFKKLSYYVGGLSAASLHGASHQAPQELQIMTSYPITKIKYGKTRIKFLTKKRIENLPTQKIKTQTGMIDVSPPEVTVFDLLMYPKSSGHLNNIATIISELSEKLDPLKLVDAAKCFDLALAQRVGYLLDYLKMDQLALPLLKWVIEQKPEYNPLKPGQRVKKINRNNKWHILINETVEPDL